jgi:uncharacterized protein YciI
MAYEPTVWKNRVVERPLTFNMVNNPDGTVTLVPAPGVIVEPGTPVNAVNLNKLEQGLRTHEAEKATETKLGHVKAKTKEDGALILPINILNDNNVYNAVLTTDIDITKKMGESDGYGGDIRAIAADDNYVYVGGLTTQTVKKLNKFDLSQIAESASYGGNIYAIAADDNYVYVGGLTTQTVKKLNKFDLSQIAESASYGGNIYAIAADDNYVYVGGLTTQTVKKLNKFDLSQIAESANYGGDIRAIAVIVDDNCVYVGGLTTRTVWRLGGIHIKELIRVV